MLYVILSRALPQISQSPRWFFTQISKMLCDSASYHSLDSFKIPLNSTQNSTFSSQFHCTAMKLSMWVIDSVLDVSKPGFQNRVFWAESPRPDFLVSKMKDLDTINLYGYSTCEMLLFFWNLKLIDIFLILSLKLYHIKPRIIEGIQISFGYDCCSSHFKEIWDNILSFIIKTKSM